MAVTVDTSELDALIALMQRRETIVPDSMREGQQRADSYAAAGGRHRVRPGRFMRRADRPVRQIRLRRATGNQVAVMTEHVLYHKFIDWWGNW